MTSANYFQGYSSDKPSSKVLNPPGGRSNNIFGFAEDDSSSNHGFRPKTQQQIENNNARQASSVFESSSNQSTASNAPKKRSGYNLITGESYEVEETKQNNIAVPVEEKAIEKEPAKAENISQEEANAPTFKPIHTSSRVLQPPGGRSTALW